MPSPIDITALIADITKAATVQLGRDVTALEGFSQAQVEGLARQAQLIAAAFASGHLSDADRDFFLNDLKQTAQDFARTLAGLALVDIEKVWNAAVTTLWTAIGTAAQVALPKPFERLELTITAGLPEDGSHDDALVYTVQKVWARVLFVLLIRSSPEPSGSRPDTTFKFRPPMDNEIASRLHAT